MSARRSATGVPGTENRTAAPGNWFTGPGRHSGVSETQNGRPQERTGDCRFTPTLVITALFATVHGFQTGVSRSLQNR